MTIYRMLGITDDVTSCDCCGKTNLKCTVALETESGEIVHFGRDCASYVLYGVKGGKMAEIVAREAKDIAAVRAIMAATPRAEWKYDMFFKSHIAHVAWFDKHTQAVKIQLTDWAAKAGRDGRKPHRHLIIA